MVNAAPVNSDPDSGVKLVDLVGLIDYLVLNESEAELLTGKRLDSKSAAIEVTKEILNILQCVAVITTLGSEGAIVATTSEKNLDSSEKNPDSREKRLDSINIETRVDHVPAPDVGPALDTTVGLRSYFHL